MLALGHDRTPDDDDDDAAQQQHKRGQKRQREEEDEEERRVSVNRETDAMLLAQPGDWAYFPREMHDEVLVHLLRSATKDPALREQLRRVGQVSRALREQVHAQLGPRRSAPLYFAPATFQRLIDIVSLDSPALFLLTLQEGLDDTASVRDLTRAQLVHLGFCIGRADAGQLLDWLLVQHLPPWKAAIKSRNGLYGALWYGVLPGALTRATRQKPPWRSRVVQHLEHWETARGALVTGDMFLPLVADYESYRVGEDLYMCNLFGLGNSHTGWSGSWYAFPADKRAPGLDLSMLQWLAARKIPVQRDVYSVLQITHVPMVQYLLDTLKPGVSYVHDLFGAIAAGGAKVDVLTRALDSWRVESPPTMIAERALVRFAENVPDKSYWTAELIQLYMRSVQAWCVPVSDALVHEWAIQFRLGIHEPMLALLASTGPTEALLCAFFVGLTYPKEEMEENARHVSLAEDAKLAAFVRTLDFGPSPALLDVLARVPGETRATTDVLMQSFPTGHGHEAARAATGRD